MIVETPGFLCVLGAGCKLGDAARLLAGKRLVIAEDADRSGRDAADRWTAEAYDAGCASVESFIYAPGIKDFSDHLAALIAPAPTAAPATEAAKPTALPTPPLPMTTRPLLVPMEVPWQDGQRYSLAGAHEIRTRLPLFLRDDRGDTRRAHGSLIFCPLT